MTQAHTSLLPSIRIDDSLEQREDTIKARYLVPPYAPNDHGDKSIHNFLSPTLHS